MGRKVTISSATLNLWSMDFQGNLEKILQSISDAKNSNSKLRVGSELEVTGYSCQDHFMEPDTYLHSWEVLIKIMDHPDAEDILIFVGMPVLHKNVSYNCMVAVFNKKILLIRPKQTLCDGGNYRESRWFSPWRKFRKTEDYYLPQIVQEVDDQKTVPIGDAVISTLDTCIGFEICEELWATDSPHIWMALDGVEIILNSSASHHELRKSAYVATSLVKSCVAKNGGIYVYTNQRGCDGDRLYFDGVSIICINGDIVARSEQFALDDVETITATLDLEEVRSFRLQKRSSRLQATSSEAFPRIELDFSLSDADDIHVVPSKPIQMHFLSAEEQIAYGPACWLWDYLRRSNMGGFLLPLSGGMDSAATACLVYSMCRLVCQNVKNGNEEVLDDVRRVLGDSRYTPSDPRDLSNRLFVTCYIATENSSSTTRKCAENLAKDIGSHHITCNIDTVVSAVLGVFKMAIGILPNYRSKGGEPRENLALQNIQARLRMLISYMFAQLVQWSRSRRSSLLVLGSANVDESLCGYLTKYDCSSADINPIGGLSKSDLKQFLEFAMVEFEIPSLRKIIACPPTAELEPLIDGQVAQTDEADIGLTYDELSSIGKLRKPGNCGPYSMFCKLVHLWNDRYTPVQVAEKVERFFRLYSMNRHKSTILTPAYYAESYSPDDHRYDHRQFLYNCNWPWQFKLIDSKAESLMEKKKAKL